MIPRRSAVRQTPRWQIELAQAYTDPEALLEALGLDAGRLLPHARLASRQFPLRVPKAYVDRMRPGDAADPLLRQVLPLGAELNPVTGFGPDPVGDRAALRAPGLLHKYAGRVLLNTTPACAVHCRYCFRRHFPYADAGHGPNTWDAAIDYIRADVSINEVILSGGDPLSLSDARLRRLTDGLAGIAHLRRLRIHTRLPIVLPARVDDGLLSWLEGLPWSPVMVVHCNHPAELDGPTIDALKRLRDSGLTLLNQAVVLAGVNDDADTLVALSEKLFQAGTLPYYLHLLDRVAGAAHFEVDEHAATALHAALRERLPGYLVPRLVREIEGAPSKTPVSAH
ncbi:MAG: EF-P beta-lysylation protein EpmB [Gammaproteobacteria bacterium]